MLGLFQLGEWQFGDQAVGLKGVEATITPGKLSVQDKLSDEQIEQLVADRLDARKQKNFAKADEIRKSLATNGIIIEDKPDGTSRWKR